MHLLILPGYIPGVLSWAQEMQRRLADQFDSVHVHKYLHWETGEDTFAWEHELNQIAAHLESKDKYGVLALSIGSLLALKGVHEGILQPSFCVFLGAAVHPPPNPHYDLPSFVSEYAIPTLFIQQTADPASSFVELKSLFTDHKQAQFIEIDGDDHWYADEEDCNLVEESLVAFAHSISP